MIKSFAFLPRLNPCQREHTQAHTHTTMMNMFISVCSFSVWLFSERLQVPVRGREINIDEQTVWELNMLCSKANFLANKCFVDRGR